MAPKTSALTFRDADEEYLLFFSHDPARDAFGPYRWGCLAAEAFNEGYGRFTPDARGVEDFVRCVFDQQHTCRERQPRDPRLWLSTQSTTNPCLVPQIEEMRP